MEILRKSLKLYILAILLFLLMTFCLAAITNLTSFNEEWGFTGLIVVLALITLMLGFAEGKIVGKKGLLTGMAASALFMLLILLAAGSVFAEGFGIKSLNVFYLIPIISGTIGGIIGTNSNK